MEIVANNDLQILAFVLELLRKAVLALATLADCFLSLARLAAVLNKLPKLFNSCFCSHCVKVINERFNKFDDNKYITCFFLNSHFRSAALKKVFLKKIIKCVAAIGKRLGFNLYKIDILLSQLRIEFRMGQVKSG
ncbi:ribonuclease H-like domain-containing protein [Rhizophagus irregularis DAOM 181602=DAOM 197198]|nr:ribonuclease H-like domain-containing protein [Rhizophagus irregularis DAOM 181602=DAOM 197198]